MSVYLRLSQTCAPAANAIGPQSGEDPTIGPLDSVHTTAAGDISMSGPRETLEMFFPDSEIHFRSGTGEHVIQLDTGSFPYAGNLYDRWSLCSADPSLQNAQTPVKPVCDVCGSDDLVKDAAAAWDVATQAWVLLSTYDSTTCQACEREGDDICRWPAVSDASPTAAAPVAD